MSAIFEAARIAIYVADYIGVSGDGKLNAVGLGVNILGLQPNTSPPASAPLTLAVVIEIPKRFGGDQFAWSIELRDLTTDSAVQVPTAPDGHLDALRIQQMTKVEPPNIAGLTLPDESPCRTQVVMAFTNGLPLSPNHAYEWRVSIDGQRRKSWAYTFVVLGAPPPPIFGGPVGPASIPNLAVPDDDDPVADDDATSD